jgi:hypothetical protein
LTCPESQWRCGQLISSAQPLDLPGTFAACCLKCPSGTPPFLRLIVRPRHLQLAEHGPAYQVERAVCGIMWVIFGDPARQCGEGPLRM